MLTLLSYHRRGRCADRNHLEAGAVSAIHVLMPDSLEALHQQIDDLTDPDGDFAVVCPLSGKRPVPVRGTSFPSAEAAEEAVDLVVEYRHCLRGVDPYLENIPIVACERDADLLVMDVGDAVTLSGDGDDEWFRMDDAPVVRVREEGEPVDDAAVERQLKAKL